MRQMMQISQLVLSRYEVVDLLNMGGQAIVAKGKDLCTGAEVAIRQLAASPTEANYNSDLARFKRNARLHIEHPLVVNPIDAGEEDGEHYMIMPFIEGADLHCYVTLSGDTLRLERAVEIAVDVAQALDAGHRMGIVHRDVKPQNIRIGTDRKTYLLDYGICRNLNEKTITTGKGFLGTLPFMSPEQLADPGSEDHRTDLYSLGCVFYFMMTGSHPVAGQDPASLVTSICTCVPPSPRSLSPWIPEHVDRACMKLLANRREERFQTAQEFVLAVQGKALPAKGGFCASCGRETNPGAAYCSTCGAMLADHCLASVKCLACGATVGDSRSCPGCRKPFSDQNHRLSFTGGVLTGTVFRIPEGIYDVGRGELSPRDQYISRRQLSVACSNGQVRIQDAGSANKTLVDERPANRPTLLTGSQEVRIAGNIAAYSAGKC